MQPCGPQGKTVWLTCLMLGLTGLGIAWPMRRAQEAKRALAVRHICIPDCLCETDSLGRKTKAGCHAYPPGAQSPRLSGAVLAFFERCRADRAITSNVVTDVEIVGRAMPAIVDQAALLLAESVADGTTDIDVVLSNGHGFLLWKISPSAKAGQSDPGERVGHHRHTPTALQRIFRGKNMGKTRHVGVTAKAVASSAKFTARDAGSWLDAGGGEVSRGQAMGYWPVWSTTGSTGKRNFHVARFPLGVCQAGQGLAPHCSPKDADQTRLRLCQMAAAARLLDRLWLAAFEQVRINDSATRTLTTWIAKAAHPEVGAGFASRHDARVETKLRWPPPHPQSARPLKQPRTPAHRRRSRKQVAGSGRDGPREGCHASNDPAHLAVA